MFEYVNEREGRPRCSSGANYYGVMDFDATSYVVGGYEELLSLSSLWTKWMPKSRFVASGGPGGRFSDHEALTAQLCE